MGYPINRYNGSLFPLQTLQESFNAINSIGGLTWPITYTLSDRSVDTSINMVGLLNKITYVTGGEERITYGTNEYRADRLDTLFGRHSLYSLSQQVDIGYQEVWDIDTIIHLGGKFCYDINVDYYSSLLPRVEDRDMYYIDFAIYDVVNENFISGFENNATSPVFPTNCFERVSLDRPYRSICRPNLPPGRYQIVVDVTGDKTMFSTTVKYTKEISIDSSYRKFFGVVVKSIAGDPLGGGKIQKRDYHYNVLSFDSIQFSLQQHNRSALVAESTIETNPHNYFYKILNRYVDGCGWGWFTREYYSRHLVSDPAIDYNSYNGRPYAYEWVMEVLNDSSFTAVNMAVAASQAGELIFGEDMVYPPIVQENWKNGLVLNKFYGEKTGNVFSVVQRDKYAYTREIEKTFKNYSSKKVRPLGSVDFSVPLYELNKHNMYYYPLYSVWFNRTEEHFYKKTDDGVLHEEILTKYHPLDKLPQEILTKTSRNKNKKNQYARVVDYRTSDTLFASMYQLHQLSNLVERKSLVDNQEIFREVNHYNRFFNFYKIDTSRIVYLNHSVPKKMIISKYNTHGNILEVQNENDIKDVYLWGYNSQYPVVKIVGSDLAAVLSIPSLDTSLLNNGNQIQRQSQLTLIRNHFADNVSVQVFSYSYKPLIGMTSDTDPSGRTTYYEYDSFGRLSKVKDDQGNIVKHICYNYTGQVINCNQ